VVAISGGVFDAESGGFVELYNYFRCCKNRCFFKAKPGGNAITALLFQVLQYQVVPKLYKIRWFPCVCIAISGGCTSGCFSTFMLHFQVVLLHFQVVIFGQHHLKVQQYLANT
jgi:hypothetical protein